MRFKWLPGVLIATVGIGSGGGAQVQVEDSQVHVVLPRDAIRAIDAPEFESVAEADAWMADDELMIGLVGLEEQRAYSTWQLDTHEIVNDVFEGRPIAATW